MPKSRRDTVPWRPERHARSTVTCGTAAVIEMVETKRALLSIGVLAGGRLRYVGRLPDPDGCRLCRRLRCKQAVSGFHVGEARPEHGGRSVHADLLLVSAAGTGLDHAVYIVCTCWSCLVPCTLHAVCAARHGSPELVLCVQLQPRQRCWSCS